MDLASAATVREASAAITKTTLDRLDTIAADTSADRDQRSTADENAACRDWERLTLADDELAANSLAVIATSLCRHRPDVVARLAQAWYKEAPTLSLATHGGHVSQSAKASGSFTSSLSRDIGPRYGHQYASFRWTHLL